MQIDKIKEKTEAIRKAESCIHSCMSVNPFAVPMETFVLLNELKMDLLDHLEEQNENS